jgi:large conductance mechanosensitive channel protein
MVILNHMLKGFKDFILRGNVLDLAVGIIMGTAFTAVVTALVQSVLMPAISMLVQSPNFDSFLVFGQIKIGVFLTAVVNFLLIAAAVYFAVVLPVEKLNARVSKKKAEDMEDTELSLLKEIRDSLATKK